MVWQQVRVQAWEVDVNLCWFRPIAAGSRVPSSWQRLMLGYGSRSVKSWPPDLRTSDRWPRPWPRSCVEMNFHVEMDSCEASKVSISRKESIWKDTQAGSEREVLSPGSLNLLLHRAFLLSFLWPFTLLCLVLIYLVRCQDPPKCGVCVS